MLKGNAVRIAEGNRATGSPFTAMESIAGSDRTTVRVPTEQVIARDSQCCFGKWKDSADTYLTRLSINLSLCFDQS
jgi:hypothetical protein